MIAAKIRNSEVAGCLEQIQSPACTTISELLQMVTAFNSYQEFIDANYTPSLYPYPGRSNRQKVWNAAVVELADRLEGLGHSVYRGM